MVNFNKTFFYSNVYRLLIENEFILEDNTLLKTGTNLFKISITE